MIRGIIMTMLTINIHVDDSIIIVTHRDVWTRYRHGIYIYIFYIYIYIINILYIYNIYIYYKYILYIYYKYIIYIYILYIYSMYIYIYIYIITCFSGEMNQPLKSRVEHAKVGTSN